MADTTTLQVQDPLVLREELGLNLPAQLEDKTTGLIESEADRFANEIVGVSMGDHDAQKRLKDAVEGLGLENQRKAAQQSKMLQAPINEMSSRGEEGSEVANSLVELQLKIEELDPNKINFGEPGWFGRAVGKVPVIGKKLKKYFAKYQKSQTVINIIINSLKKGKAQLTRDNEILAEDQKSMREMTIKLRKAIELGTAIDKKLDYKLQREITSDNPLHQFVSEEVLFPLRQRVMDLQQQLAVNQQGVLAMELIIRNNRELIRGVERALTVTVSALQVAVTVALALGHQKMVLDKIEAVNRTTSDLIAGTAARLKQQGAAIHKQAASGMLEMDKLKSAFSDLNTALIDISSFRQEALPKMAATILELNDMAVKSEETITRLEKGNQIAGQISWEVLD